MPNKEWQRFKGLFCSIITVLATGYGFASDMLGPLADLNRPLALVALLAWGVTCWTIRRTLRRNERPAEYLYDIRRLSLALSIALGIVGPFIGWLQERNKSASVSFASKTGENMISITFDNAGKEDVIVNQIEARYSVPLKISTITHINNNIIQKTSFLNGVVRTANSPTQPLTVDSNGVMIISNGGWGSAPIKNTCDAISSNLPCRVPKGGSIAITVARNRDGVGFPFSPYIPYIESLDKPAGSAVKICVRFDHTYESCTHEILL